MKKQNKKQESAWNMQKIKFCNIINLLFVINFQLQHYENAKNKKTMSLFQRCPHILI